MSETDTQQKPGAAPKGAGFGLPSLEDMQHWTWVIGRAQQMMLEHGLDMMQIATAKSPAPGLPALPETSAFAKAQADFWTDSLKMWQRFLTPA